MNFAFYIMYKHGSVPWNTTWRAASGPLTAGWDSLWSLLKYDAASVCKYLYTSWRYFNCLEPVGWSIFLQNASNSSYLPVDKLSVPESPNQSRLFHKSHTQAIDSQQNADFAKLKYVSPHTYKPLCFWVLQYVMYTDIHLSKLQETTEKFLKNCFKSTIFHISRVVCMILLNISNVPQISYGPW
jgi:hypothetical protein